MKRENSKRRKKKKERKKEANQMKIRSTKKKVEVKSYVRFQEWCKRQHHMIHCVTGRNEANNHLLLIFLTMRRKKHHSRRTYHNLRLEK
jgi:hypothetical protein